jgi:TRAP-type C4-dicarboxylate transport system substrate-binding protein
MDRRSVIKHAGIAGVLAAGAAPAVHAQAAIRWRLASSFPKALDTIYGAAEVFAQKINAMTAGKFSVSVHAAGELMPPLLLPRQRRNLRHRYRHSFRLEQPPVDGLVLRRQRHETVP